MHLAEGPFESLTLQSFQKRKNFQSSLFFSLQVKALEFNIALSGLQKASQIL